MAPSPLTVAVEQGTATFQCRHLLAGLISWRVNGILLNTAATFSNVSAVSFPGVDGVSTHILSIGTLLVYNGTTIECVAAFIDGSSPQYTTPVPLFIQGIIIIHNYYRWYNYASVHMSNCTNQLLCLNLEQTPPKRLRTQPFKGTILKIS